MRKFDDDELYWYALDVVRQKEYVAGYIFNRRGWMTFIPTETSFRKKNRYTKSRVEVVRPVLPGLVFVGFPHMPDWPAVHGMNLVNGVVSVPDAQGRVYPRRIDTASRAWIAYRGGQLDGRMTLERQIMLHRGQEVERSVALVHVQGRGVVRSPKSLKAKASSDRPVLVRAAGERAQVLGAMMHAHEGGVRTAA